MYMQLFGVLADVGLFTTVVREISKAPAAHRGAGRQHARRCGCCSSSCVIALAAGVSLLLPYEPDVRVAILLAGVPLLFGMLDQHASWPSSSRGCGWAAPWSATWSGAPSRSGCRAGGRRSTSASTPCWARPPAARWPRWSSPGCSRAARRGALPRVEPAVWRTLLEAALPLGLALAINALYFRADTLIISLYEPYDAGRPLHARLPDPRARAGGRHGLPRPPPSRSCRRRSRATSRARGARSRSPPRCS